MLMTWILVAAVGMIVLAIVFHYAVPVQGVKIPTIILATLGGFAAGGVLGMLGAVMYGESVQREVYGDLYKPAPMPGPGSGTMRPPSRTGGSGGGAPPEPENKEEAPAKTGGGPGGTNLRADYPGRKGDESAPVPAAPGGDAPK